jgi:hypothetical protein
MKTQIRAKSRIRGRDWPFFAVRIKNKGAGGLVGLMSGDALSLCWFATSAGKLLLESITAEPPEKWTASAYITIVLGLIYIQAATISNSGVMCVRIFFST